MRRLPASSLCLALWLSSVQLLADESMASANDEQRAGVDAYQQGDHQRYSSEQERQRWMIQLCPRPASLKDGSIRARLLIDERGMRFLKFLNLCHRLADFLETRDMKQGISFIDQR